MGITVGDQQAQRGFGDRQAEAKEGQGGFQCDGLGDLHRHGAGNGLGRLEQVGHHARLDTVAPVMEHPHIRPRLLGRQQAARLVGEQQHRRPHRL